MARFSHLFMATAMLEEQLSELRRQLIAQGHGNRYAQRLCDELRDHALSELEAAERERESIPANNLDRGEPVEGRSNKCPIVAVDCLGSVQVLAEHVRTILPPTSLIGRHPYLLGLFLPSLLALLLFWLNVAGTWQLSQVEGINQYRPWLISGTAVLQFIFACGLAGLMTYWIGAWPFNQIRLWALLVVLTVFGFVDVQWAGCSAASTGLFRIVWGINAWQIVAPWVGAVSTTLLLGKFAPHFIKQTQLPGAVWYRPVIVTLLVVALFLASIPLIRDATRRHPYDNFLKTMNHPLTIANQRIETLRDSQIACELGLSDTQVQRLQEAVADYDQQIAELSMPLQTAASHWQPFDPQWARSAVEARMQAQYNILLTEQHSKLDRLITYKFGGEALLLDPIRDHLRLSADQIRGIKDLLLEHQLADQELRAKVFRSPVENRASLAQERSRLQEISQQQIFDLLTDWQHQRWRELPSVEQWHQLCKSP